MIKIYEPPKEPGYDEMWSKMWIPCSKKPPEGRCIVSDAQGNIPYMPKGIVTIEDDEHGRWSIDARFCEPLFETGPGKGMFHYENRIIAWIPAPEPYLTRSQILQKESSAT